MSQIIKNLASGPVPPTVPTSFVTDSGTVIPAANVVNLNGRTTSVNNNNGITVIANPNLSNNAVFELTNRITGSVTTTDATPTTLASFSLGATPGVFTFDIQVTSFNATDVNGDGYSIFGTARTDGATAVLCGTPDKIVNEEVIDTADANMIVSGNNVVIQVIGIVAKTHRWRTVSTYVQVV